jgi:hypothetical protein
LAELRDALLPEVVTIPLAELDYYGGRKELLEEWKVLGAARARLAAAIAHALRFETWRSLVREEALGDDEAADLMVSLAQAGAGVRGLRRRDGQRS